ncbi:MAG: serine/threonine-protein phosphatase [Ruminococcus sp.]|nr:serine/threonine-protein phosphatase [Ruminococcus sp.]
MSISDIFDNFKKRTAKPQKIYISYASNKGKVRARNEDDLYIDGLGSRAKENMSGDRTLFTSDSYVFAVCDGMGGEQFGDEAAAIASDTIAHHSAELREAPPGKLHDAVNDLATEANNRITSMVYAKRANLSGSTLVLAVLHNTTVYVFNLGDSRAYYYSDGKIKQITYDHTVANMKVKANIFTEEEAKNSSDSHRLTSFLGVDDRWIGIKAQAYEPFDISGGALLLCSDGLFDMCTDEEIAEVMADESEGCAQRLVEIALENGGRDNITCMIIKTA